MTASRPRSGRAACLLEFLLADKPHHVIQQDGLALALPCFARTTALVGGKLTRDDRGEQEKQERYPLFRIGNREFMERLDEEPVENQKRKYGREHSRAATEGDGCREHGDEVQHRDVGQVDRAKHQANEDALNGDRAQSSGVAQQLSTSNPPECPRHHGGHSARLSNAPVCAVASCPSRSSADAHASGAFGSTTLTAYSACRATIVAAASSGAGTSLARCEPVAARGAAAPAALNQPCVWRASASTAGDLGQCLSSPEPTLKCRPRSAQQNVKRWCRLIDVSSTRWGSNDWGRDG